MFLHLNFLHIAFNMVTLLIVGPAVEVMLGKVRFLTLYLLAGLGGSVASYLLVAASVTALGHPAPSSGSWAPTWSWPTAAASRWPRWSS